MGNSPLGFIMYFIANFMIKKFNYATPGRNGNYEQMMMPCREMVQQQVLLQARRAHKSLTSSTFLVTCQYRRRWRM